MEKREIFSNESNSLELELEKSLHLLEFLRIVNVYSSICIFCFGLIGNSFVIIVFSKKRNRSNPSYVFILVCALVDNLFLIIHFFEVIIQSSLKGLISPSLSEYAIFFH